MTNNTSTFLLLATAVAGLGGRHAGTPGDQGTVSCRSTDDPYSRSVLGAVRKTLTDERLAPVRTAMNLRRLPGDSVTLVQVDMLCDKVAKAIAVHERHAIGDIQPVVVRIGSQLWAQDPSLRGGEYSLVYILNAEGTRVLGQY